MAELHGVETIELTQGTVSITTINTAIIGLVGTAPDAASAVAATLTVGSFLLDSVIVFTAAEGGRQGNALKVYAVAGVPDEAAPTDVPTEASFDNGILSIVMGCDDAGDVTATAAEVADSVNALASGEITAELSGTGAGIMDPFSGNLAGGEDEPFPLNTPVVVVSGALQAAKLGEAGTLLPALTDIYDQTGALVIVVRAASADTEDAQRAALIAAMQGLVDSKTVTTYQPRILVTTGFSEDDSVAKALETKAAALRAIAYVDCSSMATAQECVKRRSLFGTRVELLRPRVAKVNPDGTVGYRAYSACAAGLRVRIDMEKGWWWSKSNQEIYNITGLEQADSFAINDPNSMANLLNMDNVSTIIRYDGFRHWGNRLCTTDTQWRFESVRRTADVIEDSIEQAMMGYLDRPLDKWVRDDILGSINAYMRQLKGLGAIFGGTAWYDEELNTAESLAAGELYINYDFGPKSPLEKLTMRVRINNEYGLTELAA